MTKRILIVDDEPGVLDAWQRFLSNRGYWTKVALSGEAGLALVDEHAFDVVVADFIMPIMDGVEFLRQARQRLPLVRSILVSGKLDTKVAETDIAAIATGAVECDRYFHKPLSGERLATAIEDLLGATPQEVSWKALGVQMTKTASVPQAAARQASKSIRKLAGKPRRKHK